MFEALYLMAAVLGFLLGCATTALLATREAR